MKKLRIGILIRDFKTLENWELRIIETIKSDPDLELALLIMDGRNEEEINDKKTSLSERILKKGLIIKNNSKNVKYSKKIY